MREKLFSLLAILFVFNIANAQTITQKLDVAVKKFQQDNQMKYGIIGFYVIDAKTGNKIYGINENTGLAPASTLKVITSAAAYSILGKDFKFQTKLGITGGISESGIVNGNFIIAGSGDPTLGSWRWEAVSEKQIKSEWLAAIEARGVKGFSNNSETKLVSEGFTRHSFSDGWIWQDIGNYYGARPAGINWRENQFDLHFAPANNKGGKVKINRLHPHYVQLNINTGELFTGARGSGDNAYVYPDVEDAGKMMVAGTVPLGEFDFSISAAHPSPAKFLGNYLNSFPVQGMNLPEVKDFSMEYKLPEGFQQLHIHYSPPIDSISYHFLRRSINLYGEAFVKAIALNKAGIAHTDTGLVYVKKLFEEAGIDKHALNIIDGSGLSPQNRVTAKSLTQVLQYAGKQTWYSSYYYGFPVINGMKMKSGSINGARAYAGYHQSASGREYIFAIIVNNYSGTGGAISRKMFEVLNVLK